MKQEGKGSVFFFWDARYYPPTWSYLSFFENSYLFCSRWLVAVDVSVEYRWLIFSIFCIWDSGWRWCWCWAVSSVPPVLASPQPPVGFVVLKWTAHQEELWKQNPLHCASQTQPTAQRPLWLRRSHCSMEPSSLSKWERHLEGQFPSVSAWRI